MQIVHLGTKIQTLFALLDDDGNVVKQFPVSAELQRVDPNEFANIGAQMVLQKNRLAAESQSPSDNQRGE